MSSMFGGSKATPTIAAPAPQAPAKMPSPDDPAVVEAKRRAAMDVLSRGGRASTILTGRAAKPAPASPAAAGMGDSYSGQALG